MKIVKLLYSIGLALIGLGIASIGCGYTVNNIHTTIGGY